MKALQTNNGRRSIAALGAVFLVLISVSLSPARTGDACDEVPQPGEKCVGLNNEFFGTCASGECGVVPLDCESRQIWEVNYIGCTKCSSGGSGDTCREYKDPSACQEARCKMKMRVRYCFCAFQDCTLDPFNSGNYGGEVDVNRRECIL